MKIMGQECLGKNYNNNAIIQILNTNKKDNKIVDLKKS